MIINMINPVYEIPIKFLNSWDHIVMIFLALFYLADFSFLSLIKVEDFLGKPLSFIFFLCARLRLTLVRERLGRSALNNPHKLENSQFFEFLMSYHMGIMIPIWKKHPILQELLSVEINWILNIPRQEKNLFAFLLLIHFQTP